MLKKFLIIFLLCCHLVPIGAKENKPLWKVCPSKLEFRWNYSQIKNKNELNIFCASKMIHPLQDFLPEGSRCKINDSHIECKSFDSDRKMKICLGVPALNEWTVFYDLKQSCNRKSWRPLNSIIGEDYKCQVKAQGILCVPQDFDYQEYFPDPSKKKKKVVVKDLNCPFGAETLADIDRVYCFYKNKIKECTSPNFVTSYENKRICARKSGYYTHVWYFE